ncbi:MAG TPA: GNAT family protein, partial [Ktedonobacteraceae bacterium]|nr:GNAT family protein [Ktedonobacteraceae bacterium]
SARVSSILVHPRFRNAGVGTQMIQALLRFGFEELSLHRIDLGVFDFNIAAIRCYERAGFKREGLQREARKVNNEYWNVCIMSVLENEWKEKSPQF